MNTGASTSGDPGAVQDTGDPQIERLRQILVAPEQDRLARIEDRLTRGAVTQTVVDSLPNAIIEASESGRLMNALMPTVEESVEESVRRDPGRLVDILFPVIGPAIRKAISESLRSTFQSLNRTLEHSASLKGVQWRWEARRTGKSFAEVVLSHTLLYRVEQVFLISRENGLPLRHFVAESAASHAPELVSGMLTAIQDFVRDSFEGGGDQGLETLRLGDLAVWIESGPNARLAAVIRGEPPESLREVLAERLELIHLEFAEPLEGAHDDPGQFEASLPHLRACAQSQERPSRRGASPLVWFALVLVITSLFFLGFRHFQHRAQRRERAAFVELLAAEPGLVVTSTAEQGDRFVVRGLRDPLAVAPESLIGRTSLRGEDVVGEWKPYVSAEHNFLLRRAIKVMRPPTGVELEVDGQRLVARGEASQRWIERARVLAAALPGSLILDTASLVDRDRREFDALRQSVQGTTIHFNAGSVEPEDKPSGVLHGLARGIEELRARAALLGLRISVTLQGHTDQSGDERVNGVLRRARVTSVMGYLQGRGLGGIGVSLDEGGTDPSSGAVDGDSPQTNLRGVTVRVAVHSDGDP